MYFDLDALRIKTLHMLAEIEQRPHHQPGMPLMDAIKSRYNTSRSFEDYLAKFPALDQRLKAGGSLLEIGAGDGIAFRRILDNYPVSGVATNLHGDSFAIASTAENLPFAGESFDVVIAIHSITWEPDQRGAFHEIRRVLRPGGCAFVNLFRFSEISQLWFGDSFWTASDLAEYQKSSDFSPSILSREDSLREEPVDESPLLSKGYFVELRK